MFCTTDLINFYQISLIFSLLSSWMWALFFWFYNIAYHIASLGPHHPSLGRSEEALTTMTIISDCNNDPSRGPSLFLSRLVSNSRSSCLSPLQHYQAFGGYTTTPTWNLTFLIPFKQRNQLRSTKIKQNSSEVFLFTDI